MFPIIDFVSDCFDNINDKKYSCAIALDIRKAFDSVNHAILLNKLEHYGIRGVCHKLFSSYLENRKQYVCINNIKSSLQRINSGVPQGSELEPILFLLYINDLPNAFSSPPRLFADDAFLLYSSIDIHQLQSLCNSKLRQINQWMNANKLVINPKKSQACIIDYKLHSSYDYHFELNYCNYTIQISDGIKYLGVELDDKLNFLRHIKTLEAKLSRNFGILFKLKKILPTPALVTLYFALIHPFLSYGVILWGACNKSYSTNLRVLYKIKF